MADSPALPRSRVCANCGCFFESTCRRNPPQVMTVRADKSHHSYPVIWPEVRPYDFCVTGWIKRESASST